MEIGLFRRIRPRVNSMLRAATLVVLFASGLLVFGTRGFYVYGSCMEPNLRTGERVLASSMPYWLGSPQRGDVVIFRYPADPSKNYVKRVIGLPGDRIVIRNGELFLNDSEQPEPYKLNEAHGDYGPRKVSPGHLFVLGDNRDQSNDSRYWGELPISNVEGKALLRYWPPSRLNVLN